MENLPSPFLLVLFILKHDTFQKEIVKCLLVVACLAYIFKANFGSEKRASKVVLH